MPDEPTCGKGLAENAVLPAKISELFDALAVPKNVGVSCKISSVSQ